MSEKSRSTTFLLCYFLGIFGVHRFYLGKVLTGLLMLITLGGLTIWWLIDAILIAAGQMKDKQGIALRGGPPDPQDPRAGFWVRAAAFLVDGLILNVMLMVLGTGVALALPLLALGPLAGAAANPQALSVVVSGLMGAIGLLAVPLYFGILTASDHQATWGKRCFDLYVTTGNAGRVGFGRALWRSVGYFFSGLILGIGYIMAGVTRDKRALHDYLAGTQVMYVTESALPATSRAPALSHEQQAHGAGTPGATVPVPVAETAPPREPKTPVGLMVLGALLLAGAAAAALL